MYVSIFVYGCIGVGTCMYLYLCMVHRNGYLHISVFVYGPIGVGTCVCLHLCMVYRAPVLDRGNKSLEMEL